MRFTKAYTKAQWGMAARAASEDESAPVALRRISLEKHGEGSRRLKERVCDDQGKALNGGPLKAALLPFMPEPESDWVPVEWRELRAFSAPSLLMERRPGLAL